MKRFQGLFNLIAWRLVLASSLYGYKIVSHFFKFFLSYLFLSLWQIVGKKLRYRGVCVTHTKKKS